MQFQIDQLPEWVAQDISSCKECSRVDENVVAPCGWHENLTAAAHIVEVTAGTLVLERDPLPVRLRRYADRAAKCWEGNDADDAIAAMLEAADLLDGDR